MQQQENITEHPSLSTPSNSLHEKSTIQNVIEELHKIDPNNCDYSLYANGSHHLPTDLNTSTSSLQSHDNNHLHQSSSVSIEMRSMALMDKSNRNANFAEEHDVATGNPYNGEKKQPRSASGIGSKTTTKSHSSTTMLKIRTCFGSTIELTPVKFLNLSSLIVNFLAFMALLILIVAYYVVNSELQTAIGSMDLNITLYRERMVAACRSSVYTNNNLQLTANYTAKYETSKTKFNTEITKMLAYLPTNLRYTYTHNVSVADLRTSKAIALETQMLELANIGNYSYAMTLLESDAYKYDIAGYSEEFQPTVDYLNELEDSSRSVNVTITTISLIVVCVSICIVLPSVIASIIVSIRKDASNTKKLKAANAFLLMDTMRDNKLRKLFRDHCKQELSLDNYLLLDKITDYKILCEKSFEIQVFLYDDMSPNSHSDSLSDSGSSATANSSNLDHQHKKKKKKGYTEKDLHEIEKKKYEIAFEIYTDFLDINGDKSVNINKSAADRVKEQLDYFASGENEHLTDTLFDNVESEICVLMLDTHHRFKQTVEFQKQTQKQHVKKNKVKFESNKVKNLRSDLNLDSLKIPTK
ncbi:predicted protein [Naegleria gruberi]|uniref:Predicted protein n=1 Tax=Naegleria gruberi TaxID=5762 RepID=D2VWD0_NAEGR|nr:uncharacterized protein NAEGRDRAFT_73338 [Naegleria gruberi]EFC38877.1 predicted protein [Naegleria gruberi]|eukprot:XP_002671621.1 predicted protein [Naegleria gruberi strain NEG-M]